MLRRLARSVVVVGGVMASAVSAHAQTDAGASATAPPTAPPAGATTAPSAGAAAPSSASTTTPSGNTQVTLTAPETLQWPANYAEARQALLDGEWDRAISGFDKLVTNAPTPEDARLARELGELARYWKKRDLAFVQRQALGESSLSSKAVDRRSIDELVTLYGTMAAYGSGLGLSLAVMADAKDPSAFIIPAIVGAGTGIAGVALADTFGRIRYGQAQAIASGALLGLGEGLLFDGWYALNTNGNTGWDAKPYIGIGIATTTLGAVAGGILGATLPMTPGRASWVSSMGLWSGALVVSVSGAFAGAASSTGSVGDGVVLAGLVGYNLGIGGGILTAGLVSPSISRVRLIDLGALVGGLTSLGLYTAVATSTRVDKSADGYAALGFTGLGIAAGLATSWLLTMSMPPDRPNTVDDNAKPAPHAALSVHPLLVPLQGGASAGLAGTW